MLNSRVIQRTRVNCRSWMSTIKIDRSSQIRSSQPTFSPPLLLSGIEAVQLSKEKKLNFIDASWVLDKTKRNVKSEFELERIPGASFFDIDEVADRSTSLPHMLPSSEIFQQNVNSMGISPNSHVIVYTTPGCMSSSRVYWTFKVFGHHNVSILNGGLNAWKAAGGAVESGPVSTQPPVSSPPDTYTLNREMVAGWQEVLDAIQTGKSQILDARPSDRFSGESPEPRPGLEGGHMPGALSVPATLILKPDDPTTFRSNREIHSAFEDAGLVFGSQAMLTCGSGVTAAVLYVGLRLMGLGEKGAGFRGGRDGERAAGVLYDGSWSEWGARPDLPKSRL